MLQEKLIETDVAAGPGRAESPIFVVGCHRSGTTLTRYILDTHPSIACPPESKYLSALVPFFRHPRAMSGINGLGTDRADIRRHVAGLARSFLDDYAARKGKRRWADKTPNYYRIVELLDYLFEQQALFVFVTRHPLDVIPSLQYHLEDEFLDGAEEPFLMDVAVRHGIGEYGAARYWVEFSRRLWVFSQCIPDRTHWVRYEDLVTDTPATLTALFRFLGEDFDPSMIDSVFDVPHDTGFEFGGIRRRTAIESDRIGKWTDWPAEKIAALWDVVGPMAGKFGYSPGTP